MRINSTIVNFLKVFATILVFCCHSVIVAHESFQPYGLVYLFNTPAWGGVWIFLIVSGLLASWGFETRRYQLSKQSLKKYWSGRVIKVLLPTWIFLSLVYIFSMRDSELRWDVILRMLTCTYNGGFTGIKGAGATWYVFVLMWLYLLTPLFVTLLKKYELRHAGSEFKAFIRLLICVVGLGLTYRIAGYILHWDLYNWLYANVLACLDLYICGMITVKLIRFFPKDKLPRLVSFKTSFLVLFLLMNGIFIAKSAFPLLNIIYCYLSPSFYITFTVLIVLLYSVDEKDTYIIGFVGKFCNIVCPYSFAFYLWHSSLLAAIADSSSWITNAYLHYAFMLIVSIIVVSYVSYLMTKMNDSIIKTINKN